MACKNTLLYHIHFLLFLNCQLSRVKIIAFPESHFFFLPTFLEEWFLGFVFLMAYCFCLVFKIFIIYVLLDKNFKYTREKVTLLCQCHVKSLPPTRMGSQMSDFSFTVSLLAAWACWRVLMRSWNFSFKTLYFLKLIVAEVCFPNTSILSKELEKTFRQDF